MKSLELSESYKRLNLDNKFIQVHQCGNFLEFKKFDDSTKKLVSMISCKDRLCSMCSWRRELKIFSQVSRVIESVNSDNNYRFLFLTLTCKNVCGDDLKTQIDLLFSGFKRLFSRKVIDKAVKGWFRALEVTHDVNEYITHDMYYGNKERHMKPRKKYYDKLGLKIGDLNPNFDLYHPHLHIVIMVNKSYFTHGYISQEKWTSLWQESLKVNYKPIVYIKPFKQCNDKAVAEVSKYTVKDSDFLVKEDFELTDKTVSVLMTALAHRRLVAFGKLLKDEHKKLNLTDVTDDSDLVLIDDESISDDLNYVIEKYQWNIGYSNYVKF